MTLLSILLFASVLHGQNTAFTYQGRLSDSNRPATGQYDFAFTIYNLPTGGIAVGSTHVFTNVTVSAGLFMVTMDFGAGAFTGPFRWLEIVVRTNGPAGAFVTLTPRQPFTVTPYAIIAGSASNLLGVVSSAQLTGPLEPAQLIGVTLSNATLIGSISAPPASPSQAGLMSSNLAAQSLSLAGQQGGIARVPPFGVCGWYGTISDREYDTNGFTGISNVLVQLNTNLFNGIADRYLILDDGWASSNRDANGDLQWNLTRFPSGANWPAIVHGMGWKIGLYIDNGHPLSNGGHQAGSGGHEQQDTAKICSWGIDLIKADMSLMGQQLVAGVLATNGRPIFLTGGRAVADPDAEGPPLSQLAFMNSIRVVAGGDINDFGILLHWADVIETNGWWRMAEPSRFVDLDYLAHFPDSEEDKTHLVLAALFSAPLWWGGPATWSGTPAQQLYRNPNFREIARDAAVICARRVLQTNGCDVWLKPLGTADGPNFAVGIVNRGSAATNLSLSWTNLSARLAGSFSVLDCVSSNGGWQMQYTSGFSVGLAAHQSVLWKIVPGLAITTNFIQPATYGSTLPAVINSNGVITIANVRWDPDATNFIARAQISGDVLQCFAIQYLFSALKARNFWSRLDLLYPVIPAAPYLNAISTNFPLKPVGPVIVNAQGIAGDGLGSYFTNNFNARFSGINFRSNSMSFGVYSATAAPKNFSAFIGAVEGQNVDLLQADGPNMSTALHDSTWGVLAAGGNYNFNGLVAGGRIGTTRIAYQVGTVATDTRGFLSLPNNCFFFDARLDSAGSPSYFSDAVIQAAWVGGGFTVDELQQLKAIFDQYQTILR